MSDASKHHLAETIRLYLDRCQPGGIALEVDPDGIRQVDGWWRVPIRPSIMPGKLYEYNEALATIEQELDEKESLNVVLTTGELRETAV